MGEQSLKNIGRPARVYRVSVGLPHSSGGKAPLEKPALALPDKPSIAVLPFENISGDPEQEYFADGMVEEIITALSRVRSFFVIARNSSFTYKGKSVEVKQVRRELGVRYVLEGSVRNAWSAEPGRRRSLRRYGGSALSDTSAFTVEVEAIPATQSLSALFVRETS